MSAPLRVVIADDHPLFRTGLAYALRAHGLETVGEAADGAGAVVLCRRLRPDAALFDLKMPVMDGIAACRTILASEPAMVVLMLTTFAEPAIVRAAEQAGARAFLSKETDAATVASTVRSAIADPAFRRFPTVELPRLSARELEVLGSVAAGLTNKEIGRRLGISPETVKDHVVSLFRKLEADDRVGVVSRARALGLVGG